MLKYTGESPFSDEWLERDGQDHRITTKIDIGDFHVGADGGAACARHADRPERRLWFGLTDEQLAETYPWEDWILARSRVGPIPDDDESSATCSPGSAPEDAS